MSCLPMWLQFCVWLWRLLFPSKPLPPVVQRRIADEWVRRS
jgi:hypothetical protein